VVHISSQQMKQTQLTDLEFAERVDGTRQSGGFTSDDGDVAEQRVELWVDTDDFYTHKHSNDCHVILLSWTFTGLVHSFSHSFIRKGLQKVKCRPIS